MGRVVRALDGHRLLEQGGDRADGLLGLLGGDRRGDLLDGLLHAEALERGGLLRHRVHQDLRVHALAVAAGDGVPRLRVLIEGDLGVDRLGLVLGDQALGEVGDCGVVDGHDRGDRVLAGPGRRDDLGHGVLAVESGCRGGVGIDGHPEISERDLDLLIAGGHRDGDALALLRDERGDLVSGLAGDVLPEDGGPRERAIVELLGVGHRATGQGDGDHREDGDHDEEGAATAVAAGGSGRGAQRRRFGHVRHGF